MENSRFQILNSTDFGKMIDHFTEQGLYALLMDGSDAHCVRFGAILVARNKITGRFRSIERILTKTGLGRDQKPRSSQSIGENSKAQRTLSYTFGVACTSVKRGSCVVRRRGFLGMSQHRTLSFQFF